MVVDSRVVARSVAWRQGGADRRRRRTGHIGLSVFVAAR
jgi:hypothetical protein